MAEDGDVELASFGLLPAFIGRGIGPRLLDAALRRAWEMTDPPPGRVWVHTCSLDGPAARRTYEDRGMREYRERTRAGDAPRRPARAVAGRAPAGGVPD